MNLLKISYKNRVYKRVATLGGMDSEPAGSAIETQTFCVVIAGDSDRDVQCAVSWFKEDHSGFEDFELIGATVECQVHAILRRPITNLNIQ